MQKVCNYYLDEVPVKVAVYGLLHSPVYILVQGYQILVFEGHYTARSTLFPAPTHMLQWLNYLFMFSGSVLMPFDASQVYWSRKTSKT